MKFHDSYVTLTPKCQETLQLRLQKSVIGQGMSAKEWEGHIYAAAQQAAASKKGKQLPLGIDDREQIVRLITD